MDTAGPFTKPLALIASFAALSILYIIGQAIYDVYFHPLRKIPGPKLNAVSRIPFVRHLLAGTIVEQSTTLHDQYGDVVRVSPNEVTFISGESAWTDIYGFRTGRLKGHPNLAKDLVWHARPVNGVPSILIDNEVQHSNSRRILSHAFSDKALAEQESLIQNYVDMLINGIKEASSAAPGKAVDMVEWYTWTTFDIIADLVFGEPFGCLRKKATQEYVKLLIYSITAVRVTYVMHYFPWVKYFGSLIIDKGQLAKRKEFGAWLRSKTVERCERVTQRPDFMTHILAHNQDGKNAPLSQDVINSNAGFFIVAGSETTATLLDGATYLLLRNPAVLQKLVAEVRGRWKSYDAITLDQVNQAPYLVAVLAEALRYFPPLPIGLARVIPPGGEVISGHVIAAGTSVYMSSYVANHSARNFKDPEAFVPERWMGDEQYRHDRRDVSQAFSVGPRNCLGKNLAYAEIRLILAKFVWTFDLSLDARSEQWLNNCKSLVLWTKPELMVHVTPVVRA